MWEMGPMSLALVVIVVIIIAWLFFRDVRCRWGTSDKFLNDSQLSALEALTIGQRKMFLTIGAAKEVFLQSYRTDYGPDTVQITWLEGTGGPLLDDGEYSFDDRDGQLILFDSGKIHLHLVKKT